MYRLSVFPLNDEFVLQQDEVTLGGSVLHELLKLRTEGVEQVTGADADRILREKADPAQAGDDTGALRRRGELAYGIDAGDEGTTHEG